ncbi:MAG: AMP-binding protein [Rickettsiales bacterium]|jgi:long-chain acyl-CoA synthetase|nr:AMP-binding protein [Rickettsiales bacterium]
MNLYQYIAAASNEAPEKLFLVKEGVGYGDFLKLVRARAATLASIGVRRKETIGILARNIPEYLVSAWAAWFLGAAVLLLDNKLRPQDFENMTKLTDCKLVLAERQFFFDAKNFKFADICAADESDGADMAPADVRGGEIATLSFTSGSTGTPKIVPLTHSNLTEVAESLEDLRDFVGKGDDFLLFLPLYHIFGLAFITIHAVHYRGGVILETSGNPREIVQNFRNYKPRIVPAVPRIWEIIRNMIVAQYKDHGTWGLARWVLKHQRLLGFFGIKQIVRQMQWPVHEMFGRSQATLIGGGAAVKPDVMKFFEWFGFDFLQGYGLTEASGPDTVSMPHQNRVIGSVGKTLGPNKFRITNRDKDGIGMLWLKGPVVFEGYLNNPAANAEVFDDGWLNTGDLASTDKNGEIHIHGRSKNVIVLDSGKNVYPDELEAEYLKIDGVKNVLVIELDGKVYGLFQTEENITLDKLASGLAHANKNVAPYKQVLHFAMTTEDFPTTSSGKNKHFEAKRLLESGKYPMRK